MKLISAFPVPNPAGALRSGGPFSRDLSDYAGLYPGARDAIYQICRGLRLTRESTVWMPAFHCGVEVQAALDAGAQTGFYRITPSLAIDREDLERKLKSKPGPVLLIHYFGFPQPETRSIASLCVSIGVPLIEDCAHALFSSDGPTPLGTLGSFAAFSLRKTLPIYDGGALTVSDGQTLGPLPALPPQNVTALALKDLARRALPSAATELYHRLRWGSSAHPPEERVNTVIPEERSYESGMSDLSKRLAATEDPADIVQRRRRTWQQLDGTFRSHLVFPDLPAGVCPLFLPIRVQNRTKVLHRLASMGIETFVFGEFAHPLLEPAAASESAALRDEILGIPVHQQLTDADLGCIADAWERLQGSA